MANQPSRLDNQDEPLPYRSPGGSEASKTELRERLADLGLPTAIVADAIASLPPTYLGVLIYGSRARKDHRADSDLDVLVLVKAELGSASVGQVNRSCYTPAQLATASGTLFGVHLKRDGIPVHDPDGLLMQAIESFAPLDTDRLMGRVKHYSALLTTSDGQQFLPGLVRLGRFLLRSAIYSQAIAAGEPCFSVRELAARENDPALIDILASGDTSDSTSVELQDLVTRLGAIVGQPPELDHVMLETLVLAEWESDRERSALGVLAMSRLSERPHDYSLLPKVLL